MYNGDVSKLTNNKNNSRAIIPKTEEGIILSKKDSRLYHYVTISHSQMQSTIKRLTEAIDMYQAYSESVVGVINEVVNMQKRFAEQLRGVFETIEKIQNVTAFIQFPNIDKIAGAAGQNITPLEPLKIFVQPNTPYDQSSYLPVKRRKYELSLTDVDIVGDGFTAEGQYIKGMTRHSAVGRSFELIIRADLMGVIPDQLLDKAIGIGSWQDNDEVRSITLRDLKDILEDNKIQLSLERYRAINQYRVKSLIKRIRKKRKSKKSVTKGKTQ